MAEWIGLGISILSMMLVAITQWLNQREKKIENKFIEQQLSEVKATNDHQSAEIAANRSEVATLRVGVGLLISQIEQHGLTPVWRPD